MLLGRLLGWLMVGAAGLLASGDAVLALGPGEVPGIAAGDFVTLLAGYVPAAGETGRAGFAGLLAWPVWMMLAPMGIGLCWACRSRRPRYLFRRG